MKTIIKTILVVLMLLACAWGAAKTTDEIGYPICPGPLCEGVD